MVLFILSFVNDKYRKNFIIALQHLQREKKRYIFYV